MVRRGFAFAIVPDLWFTTITNKIDAMKALEDQLANGIHQQVLGLRDQARWRVGVSLVANLTMLLLGIGHCFRDHVLEVCPEFARFASDAEGIRKSFEGSSLETIRHMVASGMGLTVVPQLSIPPGAGTDRDALVRYLPFADPVPTRRVVLAWRRSFTRYEAIAALRNAIMSCPLEGVRRITD